MSKSVKEKIVDVVDEMLGLPEEKAHLCSAYNDENELVPGQMRFLLNREVLDLYRDIIDELEISRGLPHEDHPANIDLADPLVLMIVAQDSDVKSLPEAQAFEVARQKASGFYRQQKAQVASDAMFIAMTFYNQIEMIPLPYKEGELAFSTSEDHERVRPLPAWMQTKAATSFEFPLPERRISQRFEGRLKVLYQLSEECGLRWTLNFRKMFEIGLTKTLRLAEPVDDAGFQSQSVDRKVSKKSGAKVQAPVDQTGS